DVGFSSAYLLATRRFGADRLTGRVDYFRTRDRTWQARDNNNERGWSATASWRRDLSENVSVISELIHVASDRPARAYQGVERETTSTVLQSSVRLRF